jgi:hypothetical protein
MLDSSGTWIVVEPSANDKLEDSLNPIARVFSSTLTMFCTLASSSPDVALGVQAGEVRLTKAL